MVWWRGIMFLIRHGGARLLLVLALAALAGSAGGRDAAAQQSGGVQVQGNTRLDVNAKNINTMAVGVGNTASTNIGSIRGNTKGNTNVAVDARNVSNVVGGIGRKGCINIATKGTPAECQ